MALFDWWVPKISKIQRRYRLSMHTMMNNLQINLMPTILTQSLLSSILCFLIFAPHACSLSSPKSQTSQPMKYTYQPEKKKYDGMHITSLHRYAVKGLSGDSVSSMKLNADDGTFEDDRRFALLYDTSGDKFDGEDPSWLHKVSQQHNTFDIELSCPIIFI